MLDARTRCDINESAGSFVRGLLYLQKERRWNAGPRRGAGRRRGAPSSLRTGLPARHTHTTRQSSETHKRGERKHTQGKFSEEGFGMRLQQALLLTQHHHLPHYETTTESICHLPDDCSFTVNDHSDSTEAEQRVHTVIRGHGATRCRWLDLVILSEISAGQIDPTVNAERISRFHFADRGGHLWE